MNGCVFSSSLFCSLLLSFHSFPPWFSPPHWPRSSQSFPNKPSFTHLTPALLTHDILAYFHSADLFFVIVFTAFAISILHTHTEYMHILYNGNMVKENCSVYRRIALHTTPSNIHVMYVISRAFFKYSKISYFIPYFEGGSVDPHTSFPLISLLLAAVWAHRHFAYLPIPETLLYAFK